MKIIMLTIMVLSLIILLYIFYNLFRNEKVFRIRMKWINEKDSRWEKYTYHEMFDPSPSNWYGLKFPREKHFK